MSWIDPTCQVREARASGQYPGLFEYEDELPLLRPFPARASPNDLILTEGICQYILQQQPSTNVYASYNPREMVIARR